VRKLVIIAPATFPKFPQDDHRPIIVPLPLFPNQFAKMALLQGQPKDCNKPFNPKRKEKNMMFIQLLSPHIAIIVVTNVTSTNEPISKNLGFWWSPNYPLTNSPIE
jgi:hypothetical protein